ncbi:MAG: hypothetical protein H6644_15905 [Caldilineaceae bacterium]|nr:hypothetical protein [Caldilineaceae bacterium]
MWTNSPRTCATRGCCSARRRCWRRPRQGAAGQPGPHARALLEQRHEPVLGPGCAGHHHRLDGAHGREHFYRAVLEGIAYEQRLVGDAMMDATGRQFTEYVTMGGGSRSDLWCRIVADVTGVPVVRSTTTEATCLGAGIRGHGRGLVWRRSHRGRRHERDGPALRAAAGDPGRLRPALPGRLPAALPHGAAPGRPVDRADPRRRSVEAPGPCATGSATRPAASTLRRSPRRRSPWATSASACARGVCGTDLMKIFTPSVAAGGHRPRSRGRGGDRRPGRDGVAAGHARGGGPSRA